MEKRKWETPELIVLSRSRPEEAVLTFCKSSWGYGPGGANQSCQANMGSGCGVCSSGSSS